MLPIVWRKKPLVERLRQRIALFFIDIGYDISPDAFDTFANDNDYSYCADCNGAGFR